MILKASQRSGGKQLGLHLLREDQNEHVEVHEVSGFVSETVLGAMKEAHALSKGTRCQQYLFSVSLNPPASESAGVEVFERALRLIEEKMGLIDQPRVVVFHEKEGRRHCHAVWSRIDAQTMSAKPLPFFKSKLRDVAKQLFIENGWELPKGFESREQRDPRNFTLTEWQQANRAGLDAKQLKGLAQEAWARSDNRAAFSRALEERGLFLARGDRRSHVVVTLNGDIFAVSRLTGMRTKEVATRLGDAASLPSVSERLAGLGSDMAARMRSHIAEAKRIASNAMKPLLDRKSEMQAQHSVERQRMQDGQAKRLRAEQAERASKIRHGVKGAWDVLTGRYWKQRRENEREAFLGVERDRKQRDELRISQLAERRALQAVIAEKRTQHAAQVLKLYKNSFEFREMARTGQSRDHGRGLELGR
ncbi:Relaxase/Mobilisation nuclease domain [Brevundimonas vesicularis]|uniref:Relaxase/Mobilisation nuclease domain n=1 Tax=Brevundimonas vesicularis TaxID=41276 RepID=A0A2X1BDH3_BREVE|nr:relaxase/mobilization nuclease domain-containing protein [Brevundimonas vesicularis]SPU54787.1 Relaxase/Mobilisation nuclease domain [Brevundimonas vesicularis]